MLRPDPNWEERALRLHKDNKGKIEIKSKVPLKNSIDLSLAYTPWVSIPCLKIKEKKDLVYDFTAKGNLVAIVTDGSAVLGLGDIGPEAALPVMEGKAILFKEFGNVDAFPICLNTKDVEKIVEIVKSISPGFGGINLEDISSPRCFLIEKKLKESLDIPVFHDDQHGTAVVVHAGLINSLKLVNKKISEIKLVINGAGAAGITIGKFLISAGARRIKICDRQGILYKGRKEGMNFVKEEIGLLTNPGEEKGELKDFLKGADVLVGVSGPNLVTPEMVKSMEKNPVIFAMANPVPEIMPDLAKRAGAAIVGTGRSDFPNQINNLLAFPGILRGALDSRAKRITEKMKMAAALAIARLAEEKLGPDFILPSPLDKRVGIEVGKAVEEADRGTKMLSK